MRISYHGAFNGRPVNGSILMLQDDASVAEAVYAALGGREPKHTRMVVATEAGGVMSSDADTMAVAFKRDDNPRDRPLPFGSPGDKVLGQRIIGMAMACQIILALQRDGYTMTGPRSTSDIDEIFMYLAEHPDVRIEIYSGARHIGGVFLGISDGFGVVRDIAAPDDAAEEIHDIVRAAETPLRAVLSRHIAL